MLLVAVAACIISYLGVGVIRQVALRHKVMDVPNERSSHAQPTPRGGGLAIAVVVAVGFAVVSLQVGDLPGRVVAGFLGGAGLVAVIGLLDDLWRLSARLRLAAHFGVALLVVASVGWLEVINVPGPGEINLAGWGLPVTVIWIVGLLNIYNFMDGIDGLAAVQAVIASLCWLAASTALGGESLRALAGLILGASLGFLAHNWPPARIFMGDVGSTLLGYVFAVLPILAWQQTGKSDWAGFGVLCVAPFVFDGAFTLVRRAVNRENVLQAHRSHLYQRLIKRGYTHRQVSLLYAGLAMLSGGAAAIYLLGAGWPAALAVGLDLLLLVAYTRWVHVRERTPHKSSHLT